MPLENILRKALRETREAIGAEVVHLFLVREESGPKSTINAYELLQHSQPSSSSKAKDLMKEQELAKSKSKAYLLAKYSDTDPQTKILKHANYSIGPVCIPLELADVSLRQCFYNGEIVLRNVNE